MSDDDLVNLDDYEATQDEQFENPDAIDITSSDGPNLEQGDDLDTGAATP